MNSLSRRSALGRSAACLQRLPQQRWEFALPGPQTVDGYTNPEDNLSGCHSTPPTTDAVGLSSAKAILQDAAVDCPSSSNVKIPHPSNRGIKQIGVVFPRTSQAGLSLSIDSVKSNFAPKLSVPRGYGHTGQFQSPIGAFCKTNITWNSGLWLRFRSGKASTSFSDILVGIGI